MSNRELGEITLKAGGKTYTLVLSTAAMVALEELFSTADHEATFEEAFAKSINGSVRNIRKLLWAMTRTNHPELTEEDMNQLIDGVGGLAGLTKMLQVTARAATIDPEDMRSLNGDGAKANPRKAQPKHDRKSGGPFTSMRGASV